MRDGERATPAGPGGGLTGHAADAALAAREPWPQKAKQVSPAVLLERHRRAADANR